MAKQSQPRRGPRRATTKAGEAAEQLRLPFELREDAQGAKHRFIAGTALPEAQKQLAHCIVSRPAKNGRTRKIYQVSFQTLAKDMGLVYDQACRSRLRRLISAAVGAGWLVCETHQHAQVGHAPNKYCLKLGLMPRAARAQVPGQRDLSSRATGQGDTADRESSSRATGQDEAPDQTMQRLRGGRARRVDGPGGSRRPPSVATDMHNDLARSFQTSATTELGRSLLGDGLCISSQEEKKNSSSSTKPNSDLQRAPCAQPAPRAKGQSFGFRIHKHELRNYAAVARLHAIAVANGWAEATDDDRAHFLALCHRITRDPPLTGKPVHNAGGYLQSVMRLPHWRGLPDDSDRQFARDNLHRLQGATDGK